MAFVMFYASFLRHFTEIAYYMNVYIANVLFLDYLGVFWDSVLGNNA